MHPATSRRSLVNYLGVAVLLVGMSVGCFLYWRSLQGGQEPGDEEVLAAQENSRAYQQAVERNVGAFGLLMSQCSDALAALGQPRPLALTIMVLANLTAGGCFLVAARLPSVPVAKKAA